MWSRRSAVCAARILVSALAIGCGGDHPKHLVFISLDTVRRDHVSTYGYSRETTPRIDELAESAVVFENAFAQQTNTNPSHASMFTGLYPHVHGSRFNGDRLSPGRVTLAEILSDAGFRTAGFVSGVTMQRSASGLDRGFELYDDDFEGKRRDGRIAATRAAEWLRDRRPWDRTFLFLHLYDAHGPYLPAGPYAKLFRSAQPGPLLQNVPPYQRVGDEQGRVQLGLNGYVDRYDAMIRYEDDLVGLLLEEVDLSRTVVVILSDHGETLGERYRPLDHGGQAFDEQLRIPLILFGPGLEHRRVAASVETVDLLSTLLELLGVPLPEGLTLQGPSLMPLLLGEERAPHPVVFAQARAVSLRHADRGYRLSPRSLISTVRGPRWKLILYPGEERDYVELYDLESDPFEKVNRAETETETREGFVRTLGEWLSLDSGESPPTPLSPRLLEQLRELGYMD